MTHGIIILDKNGNVEAKYEYKDEKDNPLQNLAKLRACEIVLEAIDKVLNWRNNGYYRIFKAKNSNR